MCLPTKDFRGRTMERAVPDVADAELAVLEVLWDQGPATIRRIADQLYPSGNVSHYATVQKLLERLEAKRCAARDRTGWAHVFRATIDRSDLIKSRLQATADKLCGGSLVPLLTNLVRGRKLSPSERRELHALLAELERQGKVDKTGR
jgi:predicted transcriptional regulator